MAYGNQWMNMNPALYKNMTNEQVDWASLAQQWIKMKETTPAMPPGHQNRPTTCEPVNLLRPNQLVDPPKPSNVIPPNKSLGNRHIPGPTIGNNIEKPSAWNSWSWQQQQQWNWNWASSTAPTTKTPILEPVNSIRPPYVVSPILSEPPPSFSMITPNKPFPSNNYWEGPNTRVPPPIESEQWNKPNMLPNVDDRSQDISYMDAAKRKQLPAWIREGLEKMEREKRRKMELEQSHEEPDYSNSLNNENVSHEMHNSPNNFDHETLVDEEIENESYFVNDSEPKQRENIKNEPPPLIPRKTKAQIWEDSMLSLRQILTKLLMDVTNDMMLSVVKEVLKNTLQADIQGNQSQPSLAGKLGLGVYGSESGSSDESDDEQQSSAHKQSLKSDSDEAIQERILKRQREFSNIEARILMELDHLEDREKLVRSKFDSSVKLSADINDNGSQVVENIQTKGRTEDEGSNQKLDKGQDKTIKESTDDSSSKNVHKKKKSKSKRSSSSSVSSSSSESKKSDDTNGKYSYKKKNDKIKSKSSNKKNKTVSAKRKRRSHSRNRSRSYSRSKRSRSRSRHRSRSRSRPRSNSYSRHDRRSPHSYRSRRSRSPMSRYGSSRKYKSKRNSSSSSNESRSVKHRYRR